MALPYDKSGKISFELKSNLNINSSIITNDLNRFLQTKELNNVMNERSIEYTTNNTLFKIPYQITLTTEVKEDLIISYNIKLLTLLKLTIIVAIIGAFFARLSIESFLFFEFLLVSIFFILNMGLADFSLKKLLTEFANNAPYIITDLEEENLQARMSDSSRCPSCGNPLADSDTQCPSCKLHIPLKRGFKQYNPNAVKEKPKPEQKITYTYVEKEKKS